MIKINYISFLSVVTVTHSSMFSTSFNISSTLKASHFTLSDKLILNL
ncbi:MAG: hypothetical protein OFPII_09600 [Osedax symbiont Rs1]|nr:MAG: hypothetical protein OFPII_09600 [Osedax symbiont Rs1]